MAVCEALKAKAVKRGDIVAIAAEHSPAQVVAIFGTALADAAFTIVSHHLKREQILHQVSDCDAKCVITAARWRSLFHELMDLRGCGVVDIEIDGTLQESVAPARRDTEDAPTQSVPTNVGCIIYTSGSTGRAKGVVLPHRTLTDGARIVSGYLGITGDDTLLCLLPFSFDYGLNQILSAVYVGAKAVIFNFAFPQDLFDILARNASPAWPRCRPYGRAFSTSVLARVRPRRTSPRCATSRPRAARTARTCCAG